MMSNPPKVFSLKSCVITYGLIPTARYSRGWSQESEGRAAGIGEVATEVEGAEMCN